MMTRIVMVVALVVSFNAPAYDQATHGLLTRQAYAASQFGNVADDGAPPLTARLGLDGYLPFGGVDRYFELITTAFGTSVYRATLSAITKRRYLERCMSNLSTIQH